MGHSEGSPEREVHSNTGLTKKDRKISNKQPNPTIARTRGTTTKPRANEGKKIIMNRAELNDIEIKKKKKTQNNSPEINKPRTNKIEKPLPESSRKKERGPK